MLWFVFDFQNGVHTVTVAKRHQPCRELVAGWSTRWAALLVAKVSTPTYDRLKDRFSILLSQHSCKLVSACVDSCSQHLLRSLCTLKIPCAPFD